MNDLMIWEKNFQKFEPLREEKCQVSGKVYSDLHKNKRWKQPNAYFTGYILVPKAGRYEPIYDCIPTRTKYPVWTLIH